MSNYVWEIKKKKIKIKKILNNVGVVFLSEKKNISNVRRSSFEI